MAKGMDIMLRIKSKIEKTLPKNMEELTQKVEKMKKAYSRASFKGFSENVETELKEANNKFKIAKQNLLKASSIKSKYEDSKQKYSANLLQLRKVRSEMKRLERAKALGIKLSSEEERSLKKLNSQNKKLSDTVMKQRTAFQRYRMEVKKIPGTLDDYQRELNETERRVRSLTAQQNLLNKANNFKKGIKGKVLGAATKVAAVGITAGSAAAGYIGVTSAKAYIDFEQNMKKVQAISGATAEEYKLLEDEAMRLGATTKFTAGESAAAMEKMALAGFKTKQIIAAMGGVLDLAAASGEDVAMVSDIITDNLLPFKMRAEDTKKFADILAWGMSKTNVTVEMLGESFKYASGSAGNLGVSLEEMVGTLGLMGDQAIKSGMAGRGMDAVFSELIKKKDILSRQEIGINIDDRKGQFVGLVKTVEQFEKFLQDKTDIEKTAFLQNVFGDQGARAFSKLLSTEKEINGVTYKGAKAVAATVEAAGKSSTGMAEKMRDTMLNSASGTWTLLTSAIDGFKVSLGKLLLNNNAISFMKKLTNYISELTNVMNGVFNNSSYNLFWKNMFISVKEFIANFTRAIEPARKILLNLFGGDTLRQVNSLFGALSKTLIFFAATISTVMQVLEPLFKFIKVVGVDTILVFITSLMGIAKVVTIFSQIKAAFLFVKEIGGVIALLKTFVAILGGPVALAIAGVVAGAYLIYKHFDTIKAVVKSVYNTFIETIKKIGDGVKNLFTKFSEYKGIFTFLVPGKLIFEGIKAFWNVWDSNLSILENVKNGFKAFFSSISENIKTSIEGFKNLWKKVSEFETVKKFKRFFGFGEDEEKSEEDKAVDGSHRTGLSNVPFDGYIAELHRNERVLTADENQKYGSLLTKLNSSQKLQENKTINVSENKKNSFVFSPKIEIKVTTASSSTEIATALERKIKELELEFQKFIERSQEEEDYVRTSF